VIDENLADKRKAGLTAEETVRIFNVNYILKPSKRMQESEGLQALSSKSS
jgi:hypothetical protein